MKLNEHPVEKLSPLSLFSLIQRSKTRTSSDMELIININEASQFVATKFTFGNVLFALGANDLPDLIRESKIIIAHQNIYSKYSILVRKKNFKI